MHPIIRNSIIILLITVTSAYPFQPLFDTQLGYNIGGLHISSSVRADFNNDGYIDYILASDTNEDGNYHSKLKYFVNNGDGTFQTPVDISAGINHTLMLPGDFNNDGWQDFVSSGNYPYTANFHVYIFMNQGDGTIVKGEIYSKVSTPYLAVMDINNDGFDDILQMDFSNLNIMFSNGDGTFSFGTSGEGMIPVSLDHFGQMRPWDVNKDAYPDLLISGTKTVTPPVGDPYSQSYIATYINNADTTLSLAAEFLYDASNGQLISRSYPGYFNSDSEKDLLIRDNQDLWTILAGNDDGSFSLHESVGLTTPFPTTHGDINGDGLADILISDSENATISIRLNNGDPEMTFSEAVEYSGKWDDDFLAPSIAAVDLNNDGYDDIVLRSSYSFSTIINRDNGSFPVLKTIENMGTEAVDMLSEDFNGDGYPDIMTIDQDRIYLSYNDGAGDFLSPLNISDGLEWRNGIFSGDFNGDEIPDFAVTQGLKLFYGLAEGGFQEGPSYGDSLAGLSAIGGKAAYLNDDEFIDFALYYFGSIRVVLSDSEGSYNLESYVFSNDGFSQINDLQVVDIDQDNDMDILFGFQNGVYINYNDGAGGFNTVDTLTSGGAAGWLAVDDLNDDGLVDIAATHYDQIGIHMNSGNGSFAPVVNYGQLASGGFSHMKCADMNGDGNMDLATIVNLTDELAVFLNDGEGTFPQIQYYTAGGNPAEFVLADFDLDSTMDAAVTSSVSGREFVYLFMNGDYSYTSIWDSSPSNPIPTGITLHQNYPNPFNPKTAISYQLSAAGWVELNVYNVLGQKIATLVSGPQQVGKHRVRWDGSELSSGVYFYRLETAGKALTRRMLLLK